MPTERGTESLFIEASWLFFSCANFGKSAASAWKAFETRMNSKYENSTTLHDGAKYFFLKS